MEKWIIVLYFILMFSVGLVRRWNPRGPLAYMLAGRKVTIFPFVATVVATAYGWMSGVGEMYYEMGISAWLVLSLPYSLFAVFLALFFAKRAREFEQVTIGDLLHKKFGRNVSNIGAFILFLVNSPAMYFLMAGQVIAFAWDVEVWIGIVLSSVVALSYLFYGGFVAQVKTDLIQFVWMYVAFAVLFFFLLTDSGFPHASELPAGHLEFGFGESAWEPGAWFLLALFTFIDPNYFQRISSTDKPATARNGLLLSIFFWTLFDFLAASVALYGCIQFPALKDPGTLYLETGKFAFENYPVLLGLFYAGLLSAIMSTADSLMFYAGISFSRDLMHRNGILKQLPVQQLTRIGLLLVTVLGAVIAISYSETGVVDLFFDLHPLAVSALFFPVIAAYSKRMMISKRGALIVSIAGAGTWALYSIFQANFSESSGILKNINAIYPGLGITGILFLYFFSRRKK